MKYIALLRGINISGKNKISMSELKLELEKNNYQNVSTYLNSGNVIFESDIDNKESIMKDIYKIIKNKFNLEIPVFIMTSLELEDILSHNPDWWGTDDKEIYDNLIFIIPPTKYEEIYQTIGEQREGNGATLRLNQWIDSHPDEYEKVGGRKAKTRERSGNPHL